VILDLMKGILQLTGVEAPQTIPGISNRQPIDSMSFLRDLVI
jgi:hypothetical protein